MSSLQHLAVAATEHADRYVGTSPPGSQPLFGGLVVAQALDAAWATVPDGQLVRSVHASFLRRGRRDAALVHDVERSRDGASFSTRRVVVSQDGAPVLLLTAGFHRDEPGEDYQPPFDLGSVPEPATLGRGRYDDEVFDCRDVPPSPGPPHARLMWGRLRSAPSPGPRWAALALAYHSDHGPTRAAREPHAEHPGVAGRMSVSLDHAVWYVRPARLDRWLLSTFTPVSTAAGRGLVHGTIHEQDGRLVAVVSQEVVLRL